MAGKAGREHMMVARIARRATVVGLATVMATGLGAVGSGAAPALGAMPVPGAEVALDALGAMPVPGTEVALDALGAVAVSGTAVTLDALSALGAAPTAAPASSAAPARGAKAVAAAKRATTGRIDGRLSALRAMRARVDAAKHLTDGHRQELRALIDADLAGLAKLREKVLSETTGTAIRADARDMVEDYRVYMLVRPQTHIVIAADTATAASARLRKAYDSLVAAADKAAAAGKQVDAARAQIAALKSNLDAAEAAINGTADALLAVKPGPDRAAIQQQTAAARTKLRDARKNLREAASHARQARKLLSAAQK